GSSASGLSHRQAPIARMRQSIRSLPASGSTPRSGRSAKLEAPPAAVSPAPARYDELQVRAGTRLVQPVAPIDAASVKAIKSSQRSLCESVGAASILRHIYVLWSLWI